MSPLISAVVILAMVACLVLVPLGLPGLWLIVAGVVGLAAAGSLPWAVGLIAVAVAAAAEVGELALLRRFGARFGGSTRAFWGAVIGGVAGLFAGAPIPVIGSLITAFLGTFLGAGLVTYLETRSLGRSTRVGWGLLLARTAAVGLKVAVAAGVIAAVAVSLLL